MQHSYSVLYTHLLVLPSLLSTSFVLATFTMNYSVLPSSFHFPISPPRL